MTEQDPEAFLGYLGENTKNIACHLGKPGQLDKKVERALKQEIMATERVPIDEWLTKAEPSQTVAICRSMTMHTINFLALQ